jgi:hypothetical protein
MRHPGIYAKTTEEFARDFSLRALPTATLCIDCAKAVETNRLAEREEAEHLPVRYDEVEDSFDGEEKGA